MPYFVRAHCSLVAQKKSAWKKKKKEKKKSACLAWLYREKQRTTKKRNWTLWGKKYDMRQFKDTSSNKYNSTCKGSRIEYTDALQSLLSKS